MLSNPPDLSRTRVGETRSLRGEMTDRNRFVVLDANVSPHTFSELLTICSQTLPSTLTPELVQKIVSEAAEMDDSEAKGWTARFPVGEELGVTVFKDDELAFDIVLLASPSTVTEKLKDAIRHVKFEE
jgi:hypothetical protein